MGFWRVGAGVSLGLALAAACGLGSSFLCETDAQCQDGDAMGFCDVDLGLCTFDDTDCPSMRRYGNLGGGELAGQCVPLPGEDSSTGGEPTTSTSGNPDPTVGTTNPSTTNPSTTDPSSTTNQASASAGSTGDGSASDGGSTGQPSGSTGGSTNTQAMTFGEGDGTDVSGVTEDAYLQGGSAQNNGSHADFHIEEDGNAVGLLRFDVDALPSNATIVDVELGLHTGTSPEITCLVEVFEVFEEWDEGSQDQSPGTCNWNERTSSSAWTSPGCGPGSSGTTSLGELDDPQSGTAYTIELDPSVVQSWVDDPGNNYGLLIGNRSSTASCYGWFMSREAFNPERRPWLRVEYTTD